VPAQVDQPQWLVQLGDESMAVLEQERWASPLRDELEQALLEELIVGQGAIDARTQPAPGTVARVAVDVRRFDSLPGREARIQGSWTITGSDARSSSRCEWLIREPARDRSRRLPQRIGAPSAGSAPRSARHSPLATRRSGRCPALDSR
jgi:uncharacterized lipoprotein YmbA